MKNNCDIVIGSTGFIGHNLCKKIRNKKNLYTVSRKNIKSSIFGSHEKMDIRNYRLVENFFAK